MIDAGSTLENARIEIAESDSLEVLEDIRLRYIGKKGRMTLILKSLGDLPSDQRPVVGQRVNAAKDVIIDLLRERQEYLVKRQIEYKIQEDYIDVTLPGKGDKTGAMHPVSEVLTRIEKIFIHAGFDVVYGPEIEDEFHNFEALNIPSYHPARAMHDTFYFADGSLLRTHTSPVQIRTMQNKRPPIRIIAPGKVYRCDYDQTHSPMFHQVEGLLVDKQVTMAELKGMLDHFLRSFFERDDLQIRYRPSYFPFTEPSMEVDIKLESEHGFGRWLEVMGCGMVHPEVLKNVELDPDEFKGFAFGLGVERLAMLRFGISDLRLFFENDQQFLLQFRS